MSSSRPMKQEMYVAPASALSSAWLAVKTRVMLTGWPSADSSLVAARPSLENGTLTTMCSCSVRSARPSATMPAVSAETTSADVGPSTSSQIRLMLSPGSASSLASSEGLVVAPERMPQAAISSTSATDPESMKSLMPSTLPLSPDPLQRVVVGVHGWHLGVPPQHVPDGERVGHVGHVVHAQDRRPGVGRPQRGGHRGAQPLVRRATRDGAQEVLARDGGEHRVPERQHALEGPQH